MVCPKRIKTRQTNRVAVLFARANLAMRTIAPPLRNSWSGWRSHPRVWRVRRSVP